MVKELRRTLLSVDDNLCIGCGLCVDACPMEVLEVQDGLCVMVDDVRCLECSTCVHACPENAIQIEQAHLPEGPQKAPDAGQAQTKKHVRVTPILQKLLELLQEIHPVQIFDCEGKDIRDLDSFSIEGEQSFIRLYKADKLEKIGISSVDFFGAMTANVVSVTPAPEYDIPNFVMDWDESEGHIFFLCDLTPADDPGRNAVYFEKYLRGPLEALYEKHCTIPGLKNSVFSWVRATQSPYCITGSVNRTSQDTINRIFDCAVDYLQAWIGLWKTAEPQDANAPAMRLVHERRKNIQRQFHENDPGGPPLYKFLGKELAHNAMAIMMP